MKRVYLIYKRLCNYFELIDLGDISYYLDIKVTKNEDGIYSIDQTEYIEKIIKFYKTEDAKKSHLT